MPKRELPTIFAVRPTCDTCGSASLVAYKTINQGDGSTLQYVECRDCGERQKLVWEMPEVEFQNLENERDPLSKVREKEPTQ